MTRFISTRSATNVSVTVRGGLGNDSVQAGVGNYGRDVHGTVHMEELQNEGDDTLIIQ
jgi:hypothetical protein